MSDFLTLDKTGIAAALLVAVWLVVFGSGIFFLIIMLLFLALAAIVTRFGVKTKKKFKLYEKSRGWKNVVANGIVPMLAALAYFVLVYMGRGNYGPLLVVAYVASVAGITSDKFASELGVLDQNARMLLTLKKVKRGTSGGVSSLGLGVGFVGSLLISLPLLLLGFSYYIVLIVALSGLFGNLVDSLFGYFENKHIGNKFTSNIMCSLAAWMLCMLLFLY